MEVLNVVVPEEVIVPELFIFVREVVLVEVIFELFVKLLMVSVP